MSTQTPLVRRASSAFKFAVLAAFCGCAPSPGGPEYTELGLRAEDGDNVALGGACTPLPVLPGGTVVRDVRLAPDLSAHVLAVRDSVEVTLGGLDDPAAAERTFAQETLYGGFAETLAVTTESGAHYTVLFTAPCDATQTPPHN
jgi:hypothetical protein